MALKDLVAKSSALTEEAIEEIIADYVRYDPDEKVVHLTPQGAVLSNRSKTLIYLVALQGWPYVAEGIATESKPAEIEAAVGIAGGSLRPILKDLKEARIIAEKGGRYFVRPMTLNSIKSELTITDARPAFRIKKRKPAAKDSNKDSATKSAEKIIEIEESQTEENMSKAASNEKPLRKVRTKTSGIASKFSRWIDEGFFDEPRTLSDVQKRFHREAIIIPRTSIPQYLLGAVRNGRLKREEAEVAGKRVWVYERDA